MRTIAMAILIGCWSGCDSSQVATYSVSGRLEFADGEPVRTGTIELESQEFGTTATGTIREDGTFVLGTYTPNDGAAAGEHRVIVVQIIVGDGISTHSLDHGRPVPMHFASYESSPLTVHIAPIEDNVIVITLPDSQ